MPKILRFILFFRVYFCTVGFALNISEGVAKARGIWTKPMPEVVKFKKEGEKKNNLVNYLDKHNVSFICVEKKYLSKVALTVVFLVRLADAMVCIFSSLARTHFDLSCTGHLMVIKKLSMGSKRKLHNNQDNLYSYYSYTSKPKTKTNRTIRETHPQNHDIVNVDNDIVYTNVNLSHNKTPKIKHKQTFDNLCLPKDNKNLDSYAIIADTQLLVLKRDGIVDLENYNKVEAILENHKDADFSTNPTQAHNVLKDGLKHFIEQKGATNVTFSGQLVETGVEFKNRLKDVLKSHD